MMHSPTNIKNKIWLAWNT